MRIKKLRRAGNAVRNRMAKFIFREEQDTERLQVQAANSKLVMTLLARDEADVVRENIEYHLQHGVDFIIATDNGSKDETIDIFKEYEARGCLHLIEEKSLNLDQARWVNRMGRLAVDQYAADMIIHADADEFWFSDKNNLKLELLRKRHVDCLKVPIWNAVLLDRAGAERFPDDMGYLVKPPPEVLAGNQWRELPSSYKVIFKTSRGLPLVNMGNHGLEDRMQRFSTEVTTDMKVVHFGMRGRDQFYRKVKNGGSAVESNSQHNPNICVHWRRWYKLFQEGRLDEEYHRLTFSEDSLPCGVASGKILPIDLRYFFPDRCDRLA